MTYTIEQWRERFDKEHGTGAAAEFERMILAQQVPFHDVATRFKITKQRVSQLVKKFFPAYRRSIAGNVQSREAAKKRGTIA